MKLKKILPDTLNTFKSKKIKLAISEARELLIKAEEAKLEEEKEDILRELDHLNSIRLNLSKSLGNRIII